MRTPNRVRGFTIMELLVVIGIIVLVTALAAPIISRTFRAGALATSGRMVRDTLNSARNAAVTTRVPHRVIFYHANPDYDPDDPESVEQDRHALRILRVESGGEVSWVGPAVVLPAHLDINTNQRIAGAGILMYDAEPSLDNPAVFAEEEKVEYQIDGTVRFGANVTEIPTPMIHTDRDLVSLYDASLNRVASAPGSMPADIRLLSADRHQACCIDIDPASGRVYYREMVIEGDTQMAGVTGGGAPDGGPGVGRSRMELGDQPGGGGGGGAAAEEYEILDSGKIRVRGGEPNP